MDKENAEKLRVVIPGILILLAALPLLQSDLAIAGLFDALKPYEGLAYDIFIVGIPGALYYIFGPRAIFLRGPMAQIQANIKQQLVRPFAADPQIAPFEQRLMQGERLMSVFYNLIDNDESLKARAKSLYLNGLFLTSAADLIVISAVSVVVYFIAYAFRGDTRFFVVALISIGVFFVAQLSLNRLTAKHINLSNNQLEYILHIQKSKLHEMLTNLVKDLG